MPKVTRQSNDPVQQESNQIVLNVRQTVFVLEKDPSNNNQGNEQEEKDDE